MEKKSLQTVNDFVVEDRKYTTQLTQKYLSRKPYTPVDETKIVSFIPGTIRKVYVEEGQYIQEGEELLVLEAMKMKNTVSALRAGKIIKIYVETGDIIPKNHLMIEIQPD